MEKEKEIHTCVDCGTQNCKYKDRTYPDFCPTTHLKEEDRIWAAERYSEGNNRQIMIASAEVNMRDIAAGRVYRKSWNLPGKSMPAASV